MSGQVTTAVPVHERTKAKKRYLKRKKERRKVNLRTKTKNGQRDEDAGEKEEDDEKEDENENENEQEKAVDEAAEPKRPKKRRRLSIDADADAQIPIDAPSTHIHTLTPPRTGFLPSFPLPALPHAPSQSDLALQGLDKALIAAEIVRPSTVVAIPPVGGDEPNTVDGGGGGGVKCLSARMRRRLREIGITELFAVQTALLPFLLPEDGPGLLYTPFNPPRDVCVSAPTGSGKTLAYVIPIVEILAQRVVTRLRALIVLPTRDLVAQVRETIEVLSKGTNLKVGTATGQHSFTQEQAQLVQDQTNPLRGGSSKVDILICTPGRLIDHIVGTPNFSLQHLRFLVIDEADRLLAQSFQDWLARVLSATREQPSQSPFPSLSSLPSTPGPQTNTQTTQITSLSTLSTLLPDSLSPTLLQTSHPSTPPTFFLERRSSSCQKMLFSATLTRDPGKMAALEMRDAKYFVVGEEGGEGEQGEEKEGRGLMDVVMDRFSMPATLSEHMIILDSSQKPLVFFHLVHTRGVTNALVFTKSAESTTRLVRLFEFFEEGRRYRGPSGSASGNADGDGPSKDPLVVRAYSSDLPASERKSILDQFKNRKIHILVCSDLISRGIDISHVSHVVSYDVPVDMRKYVHRVGRTARAGREGDAWTLVEEQEARYFKQMLKKADHLDKVKRMRVGEKHLAPLLPHYEVALKKLKEVYSRQG